MFGYFLFCNGMVISEEDREWREKKKVFLQTKIKEKKKRRKILFTVLSVSRATYEQAYIHYV